MSRAISPTSEPGPIRPDDGRGAAGLRPMGQEQALLDKVHGIGGVALPEQDLAFFHVEPGQGAGHSRGGLGA